MVIERNHLEWRLDPASDARLPWVTGYGLRPIVICSEGYTSSLAAAALQDLGLARATDVAGGYRAWQAAGLPTARPAERAVVIAPGASPPTEPRRRSPRRLARYRPWRRGWPGRSMPGRSGWPRPARASACARRATTGR